MNFKKRACEKKKKKKNSSDNNDFLNYLAALDRFNVDLEHKIVYLVGEIDPFDSINVLKLISIVDKKDPGKPMRVIISSPGGDCYVGMAIFDALRSCKSEIHTIALGFAMSMGAVLLQAGDKRLISPNASLMIHEGSWFFVGGAKEGQAFAAHQKKLGEKIYHIFQERTGLALAKLKELFSKDSYFLADEALKLNLADKLYEGEK